MGSGIFRASMFTMITQELGPSSNWAFFSPSTWEMSELSIESQLREATRGASRNAIGVISG